MLAKQHEYIKYALVLLLSISLILFTQQVKLWNDPASTPVSMMTILGLMTLWLFSMMGIFIAEAVKKTKVKVLHEFPILGWVALTSLVMCLIFDFFVQAISAVDFLSITTPILTFAGISVVDRMADLRKTSWKVAIVAVFVFTGTYVGSALLSQFGLWISGS
ncbi:hypothetical protein [Aureibacillus halotolerans]|uniref:DUF340 domain-containing protein n=1 Tax=Aureibacillus halotolerans TaxID=1508390 RepID=A0A4V3D495_9BACI|nr:hypothetical protein [Aureibacillus halotolerans]TDQ33441.1 hypothetical protein EV213_13115 [Aureibacillus halotolerans]